MSFSRASLVLLVAACGSDPPAESPATKKPGDTTEVKMEAVPVASSAAPPPETPPASSAPATMASSAPTGDPSEDPSLGGPQEATLEKAVAPIRPRLRVCYKKALATDPKAAGSATFDTTIGKDGKVSAARFVKKEGLTDDFINCLTSAVKAMTFAPDRKSQVVSFTFGNTPGGSKAPPPPTAPAASYGGPDAGPQKH
ncbi:MAG: AgmX/PglI C-terminal domain-containing protein [Labilithrix sp.]